MVSYSCIIFTVAFYWLISISMVFANHFLLSSRFHTGDLSVFIAWIQCGMTIIISLTISIFCRIFVNDKFRLFISDIAVCKQPSFLVLILSYSAMLVFNNLCLKMVGVSFFQLARSFTLIFVVILSKILLHKSVSLRTVLACSVVIIGFIIGVDQEKLAGTLSIPGLLYGLATSFFVALNGIMTKSVLTFLNNNSFFCVFYMNAGSFVVLAAVVFLTNQHSVYVRYAEIVFLPLLLLSGILSFLIGFASSMQIKVTSPITHHISNNSKSVCQTLMAVLYFGERKRYQWWCSNFIIIFGALLYVFFKFEDEAKDAESNGNSTV